MKHFRNRMQTPEKQHVDRPTCQDGAAVRTCTRKAWTVRIFKNEKVDYPHVQNEHVDIPHFEMKMRTVRISQNANVDCPHFQNENADCPHFQNENVDGPHFQNENADCPHFDCGIGISHPFAKSSPRGRSTFSK